DLSVQVHPDDTFAHEVEGVPYGKTECWYVLDAEPGSELILGHNAETKQELEQMMANGEWDKLLRRIKVQPGDFVYVPSGTIHAIGKGIVILETQQSSDMTYRVYDYDRTDADGNQRELHLEKAAAVTTVPHHIPEFNQEESVSVDLNKRKLVQNDYFGGSTWRLTRYVEETMNGEFLKVSAITGDGVLSLGVKRFAIDTGIQFILPHVIRTFELSGNAEFVVSWV